VARGQMANVKVRFVSVMSVAAFRFESSHSIALRCYLRQVAFVGWLVCC